MAQSRQSFKGLATVRIGGQEIPLLNLPPDVSLGECGLCHDTFHIQDLELTLEGGQFLCRKCRVIGSNRR
jgi:hypothetical protein